MPIARWHRFRVGFGATVIHNDLVALYLGQISLVALYVGRVLLGVLGLQAATGQGHRAKAAQHIVVGHHQGAVAAGNTYAHAFIALPQRHIADGQLQRHWRWQGGLTRYAESAKAAQLGQTVVLHHLAGELHHLARRQGVCAGDDGATHVGEHGLRGLWPAIIILRQRLDVKALHARQHGGHHATHRHALALQWRCILHALHG